MLSNRATQSFSLLAAFSLASLGVAQAAAPGGTAQEPPAVEWCPADVDHNGKVDFTDFFPFLAYWFAGDCGGDVNFDGLISVQDLFDFLAMMANGSCPSSKDSTEK